MAARCSINYLISHAKLIDGNLYKKVKLRDNRCDELLWHFFKRFSQYFSNAVKNTSRNQLACRSSTEGIAPRVFIGIMSRNNWIENITNLKQHRKLKLFSLFSMRENRWEATWKANCLRCFVGSCFMLLHPSNVLFTKKCLMSTLINISKSDNAKLKSRNEKYFLSFPRNHMLGMLRKKWRQMQRSFNVLKIV